MKFLVIINSLASILFLSLFFQCSTNESNKDLSNKDKASLAGLKNGKVNLDVYDNNIKVKANGNNLAVIKTIRFNFQDPLSRKIIKKGNDKVKLELTYPGKADYEAKAEAKNIKATVEIQKTSNGFRFYGKPEWAKHVTLVLEDQGGHYFGLVEKLYPENRKSPDLRGSVVDVDLHHRWASYHENFAAAFSSFYMNSKGYGSFFDSFAKGKYRLAINGETQIYHYTGKLDWYIFYGPEGDKIQKAYYDVIGNPKYVPIWACGPIGWRNENSGSKQLVNDIKRMTEMKIPFTSWWVDRPYSDGANQWSEMNFSEDFKNPEKWISTINNKYGLELMTWIAPMVFKSGTKSDFPGVFNQYKGYFDLTDSAALKEFERRLDKYHYSNGVAGHKMDRADERFPLTHHWNDGTPMEKRRNKYVYLYTKVTHDIITEERGKDQFTFARTAMHKSQPYLSALWGGDTRSTWDGLAGNLANAIRCGFMGFPMWGSDVGGYAGEAGVPEELYARWLQWGVWNGMFEIKLDGATGESGSRLPWQYSDKLQNIFRNACKERMELIPYIYSGINTANNNGVMMKPLAYLWPQDENTWQIWDQYIFGNAFMVAPIYNQSGKRSIYLPKGKWYYYENLSRSFKGGKTIDFKVDIKEFPVFVKSNSIYVKGDIFKGNNRLWNDKNKNGSLKFYVFPAQSVDSCVYNYIAWRENNEMKNIKMDSKRNGVELKAPPFKNKVKFFIKTKEKPKHIKLNKQQIDVNYDKKKGLSVISIPENQSSSIKMVY